MKSILKIFFLLSFSIILGQEDNFSTTVSYKSNIDINIFPNDKSDFLISLVDNLKSISDTNKNHTYLKNDVKYTKNLVEILNTYIPSNEVFYLDYEGEEAEKSFYISKSKEKIYDTSNVVLFFQINHNRDFCGDTFFIFVFDLNKAINILSELKSTYESPAFEKLIEIIKSR